MFIIHWHVWVIPPQPNSPKVPRSSQHLEKEVADKPIKQELILLIWFEVCQKVLSQKDACLIKVFWECRNSGALHIAAIIYTVQPARCTSLDASELNWELLNTTLYIIVCTALETIIFEFKVSKLKEGWQAEKSNLTNTQVEWGKVEGKSHGRESRGLLE